MMAQSHKMNNGFSLLMVQGNNTRAISTRNYHHHFRTCTEAKRKKTKKCPQSIEFIMDLICGVTSGTSRVTKSDRFLSVD